MPLEHVLEYRSVTPAEPGPGRSGYAVTTPLDEARARGRALRGSMPRSAHGTLTLQERDPVAILVEQNRTRRADLVPVRIGRMLESPFAYYRGTAAVMAHDLAAGQVTGPRVVSCGDAHTANFGLFASPERRLVFDLNDFDEAATAPWEWDVKRLAASAVLGGRDHGGDEQQCRHAAQVAAGAYRRGLTRLFRMSAVERYYARVDADKLERQATHDEGRALVRSAVRKARRRTSEQVLTKLVAEGGDGRWRIRVTPPITQPVEAEVHESVATLTDQYLHSVRADIALLLSQFTFEDVVLRVVGVGSVGTACYLALFEGPSRVPLFLQVKEALPSVLETYGGQPQHWATGPDGAGERHEGQRVVSCQRILQAQSDPFLGWLRGIPAPGGERREFYVRQFRDMKGSVDTRTMTAGQFEEYVALCGRVLARAHSQSPQAALVTGYLGGSDRFDTAVADWAVAYADQVEQDFVGLEAAVAAGRLPAERGV